MCVYGERILSFVCFLIMRSGIAKLFRIFILGCLAPFNRTIKKGFIFMKPFYSVGAHGLEPRTLCL